MEARSAHSYILTVNRMPLSPTANVAQMKLMLLPNLANEIKTTTAKRRNTERKDGRNQWCVCVCVLKSFLCATKNVALS